MPGLALLSIHKDRQIDRETIVNDFVTSSNRRSDFVALAYIKFVKGIILRNRKI